MNYKALAVLSSALLCPCVTGKAAVIITALPSPMVIQYGDFFEAAIFPCDLNQDGINDFTLVSQVGYTAIQSSLANRLLYVADPPPNIGGSVAPIPLGAIIAVPYLSDGVRWSSTDFIDGYSEPFEAGTFANISLQVSTGWESAYPEFGIRNPIGVEFHTTDGIHYGYIDIKASGRFPGVVLYGWAYESQPGVAIEAAVVPEPSTFAYMGIGIVLLWARQTKTRTTRTKRTTKAGRTRRWR